MAIKIMTPVYFKGMMEGLGYTHFFSSLRIYKLVSAAASTVTLML